jgi:hypothetical protein
MLLLLPAEFGGRAVPENIVYVPAWIPAVKESTDRNVIAELVKTGKVSRYAAEPHYQGKSFVPASIVVRAWDPGELTTTIHIWGDPLKD